MQLHIPHEHGMKRHAHEQDANSINATMCGSKRTRVAYTKLKQIQCSAKTRQKRKSRCSSSEHIDVKKKQAWTSLCETDPRHT
jgi:hypothetical protein